MTETLLRNFQVANKNSPAASGDGKSVSGSNNGVTWTEKVNIQINELYALLEMKEQ